MDQNKNQFGYFLNKKKQILVVSFLGPITTADTETITRCQNEIKESGCNLVVLNFKAIPSIDPQQIPNLILFQQNVRAIPAEIFLCELSEANKTLLESKGAVRTFEIFPNLIDALQHIVNSKELK